jgi:hypothetical protein
MKERRKKIIMAKPKSNSKIAKSQFKITISRLSMYKLHNYHSLHPHRTKSCNQKSQLQVSMAVCTYFYQEISQKQ